MKKRYTTEELLEFNRKRLTQMEMSIMGVNLALDILTSQKDYLERVISRQEKELDNEEAEEA